jgi:hypothetical protein
MRQQKFTGNQKCAESIIGKENRTFLSSHWEIREAPTNADAVPNTAVAVAARVKGTAKRATRENMMDVEKLSTFQLPNFHFPPIFLDNRSLQPVLFKNWWISQRNFAILALLQYYSTLLLF